MLMQLKYIHLPGADIPQKCRSDENEIKQLQTYCFHIFRINYKVTDLTIDIGELPSSGSERVNA
ncbi:hypothetical protein GCM10028818_42610 [Spirosoma horti]